MVIFAEVQMLETSECVLNVDPVSGFDSYILNSGIQAINVTYSALALMY